jgi:prepilin-type N-terminal cleavage/methylation domain-containing protein/prepilin-type processing-associated H-X9-DG protein
VPIPQRLTALRPAFTLIELLVVISIITLLISIALPSLGKSKRAARAAICLSNQHQLQVAQLGYCDDNASRTKDISHAGIYWHHALARYLGDNRYHLNGNLGQWKTAPMSVLTCPEATRDNPVGGFGSADTVWSWGGAAGGQGSYGANLWLFPAYKDYLNDFRFPKTSFYPTLADAGSDAPLYGDSNWVGSWPLDIDTLSPNLYLGYAVHEIGYFMGRYTIDRHDRGIQIVFADGSARKVGLAELWLLKWHRGFKPTTVAVP